VHAVAGQLWPAGHGTRPDVAASFWYSRRDPNGQGAHAVRGPRGQPTAAAIHKQRRALACPDQGGALTEPVAQCDAQLRVDRARGESATEIARDGSADAAGATARIAAWLRHAKYERS
jgi:hypothetical protein